jgi:cardiolipin synthase
LTQQNFIALYLLGIAAITDGLDGWLARRYNWVTRWGSFLDPLADKVLLISTFSVFYYLGYLPKWIITIAIARDILILLGIVIYRVWLGDIAYQAIFTSKLNTSLQLTLIGLILIRYNFGVLSENVIWLVSLSMIMTSVTSFLQYVAIWVSKVYQHVKK